MFTNPSKYAIKALCVLVKHSSKANKVLVKDIAKEAQVPSPYLSKILQILSKAGYISSLKGRNGGFYLTEEQLKTPLLDIIVTLEGKDRLQHCVINFEHCNTERPCPVHYLLAPAKTALQRSLEGIQLKDLNSP